jgi:hypothetical protein
MRSTAARMLLLACSAAAICFGALGMIAPLTGSDPTAAGRAAVSLPRKTLASLNTDSIVRLIIARTPFRVARRPAAVAFDPRLPTQIEAPAVPKPVLALSGIVWGADPTAIIQGLPGIEGSKVVRHGDVVGGIKVSRIERERVWVTGLDTTWALAVREPWK